MVQVFGKGLPVHSLELGGKIAVTQIADLQRLLHKAVFGIVLRKVLEQVVKLLLLPGGKRYGAHGKGRDTVCQF